MAKPNTHFGTLLTKDIPGASAHYDVLKSPQEIRIDTNSVKQSLAITDEHSHLVIIVPKNVHAFLGITLEKGVTTHAQEIFLEDGAELTIATLCETKTARPWIAQRAKVGASASLTVQNATIGTVELTHDIVSRIEGDRGTSTVEWLFRARKKERAVISARNVFVGRNGGGEMTMKGIAEEQGSVRINGMIDIQPSGTGTNTYLTQDVLMLDPTAKVDAIPGLTIATNDVKASHSATVSRVTAEDLFYFASRGIAEKDARAMYINGYLTELLDHVREEKTRDHMKKALMS